MSEIGLISIRNIEKFFSDHPEYSNRKSKAMEKARQVTFDGVLSEGFIQSIMLDLTAFFFHEITTVPEHLKMMMEDIRRFDPDALPPSVTWPRDFGDQFEHPEYVGGKHLLQ